MQPGQPFKKCPACGLPIQIDAPQCTQCGHQFRTQFAPPNQTQAFIPGSLGDQGQQPPNPIPPYQQNPYAAYPRTGNTNDSIINLLRGIPVAVCFIIGFFIHILGILLIVGYFGLEGAKDHQKGWATVWGMVTPVALTILYFVVMFGMLVFHR